MCGTREKKIGIASGDDSKQQKQKEKCHSVVDAYLAIDCQSAVFFYLLTYWQFDGLL